MEPVELPLQSTFTWVVVNEMAAEGSVMVAEVVFVQPFASVTVTV